MVDVFDHNASLITQARVVEEVKKVRGEWSRIGLNIAIPSQVLAAPKLGTDVGDDPAPNCGVTTDHIKRVHEIEQYGWVVSPVTAVIQYTGNDGRPSQRPIEDALS
jgi:hypothetical protein